MGLFKNKVGRPSNETLERRRKFYIITVLVLSVLLGLGIYYTIIYTNSNNTIAGNSKNASTIKILGDVTGVIDFKKKDDRITFADYDVTARYVSGKYMKDFNFKNADINGDNKTDYNDLSILYFFAQGRGDIDGDGKITSNDARVVLRFSVGSDKPNATQKTKSDVDGDGSITSSDSRLVQRAAVGFGDVCGDYALSGDGKITEEDLNLLTLIYKRLYTPTVPQKNNINNNLNYINDSQNFNNLLKKMFPNYSIKENVYGGEKSSSGLSRYYVSKYGTYTVGININNMQGFYYGFYISSSKPTINSIGSVSQSTSKTVSLSSNKRSSLIELVLATPLQANLGFLKYYKISVIFNNKGIQAYTNETLSTTKSTFVDIYNSSSANVYYTIGNYNTGKDNTIEYLINGSLTTCTKIPKKVHQKVRIKLVENAKQPLYIYSNNDYGFSSNSIIMLEGYSDSKCKNKISESIIYVP